MKTLRDQVAVITGAASGIGRALAVRFAREGMKLVLADVEAAPLRETAAGLEGQGVPVVAVPTDVLVADQVHALAERTLEAYGAVHVLCNNAGVFSGGSTWEASVPDYEWVFGVNVFGVIHGIKAFVPRMLEQGAPAHVVNTASMAAVTRLPLAGAYTASKHAVLALSESLYLELRSLEAPIGVSAVCPELIATRIGDAERNRPPHLKGPEERSPSRVMAESALRSTTTEQGAPPDIIAERVVQAILEDQLYVLADGAWREAALRRFEDISLGRNPGGALPDPAG